MLSASVSNGHDGQAGRLKVRPTFWRRHRLRRVRSANILRVPSGSDWAGRSVSDTGHFRRITKPRFIDAALSCIQQLHRCREGQAETCRHCMLNSRLHHLLVRQGRAGTGRDGHVRQRDVGRLLPVQFITRQHDARCVPQSAVWKAAVSRPHAEHSRHD